MSPNVDPTGSCQLLSLHGGGGGVVVAWFSRLGQLGEESPPCLLKELQPEPPVIPLKWCSLAGPASLRGQHRQ